MIEINFPRWKHLWFTWDLRGVVILSFCLQIFLSLFSPLRKRTSTSLITIPLWFAYLLADVVAIYSLGLITNGNGTPNSFSNINCHGVVGTHQFLIALWAAFLLLHLGGPDTITAFALEDNELWTRHLMSLVSQCSGTVYLLFKTPPHNPLWVPTLLIFVNGIIKYSERTYSFYLARAYKFKMSMNTNTDSSLDYMEKLKQFMLNIAEERATTTTDQPNLTEFEILQYAYCFFGTFKGLAVDLIFTHTIRDLSQDFFLKRTAKDAFEIVELELNFLYEDLFTKTPVLYGYFGVIRRLFSFVTVCVAAIFFVFESKSKFTNVDVIITYGLLFSALALEIVGMFALVSSKRTLNFILRSRVERNTSLVIVTQFLRIFQMCKVKRMLELRTSEAKTHRWPVRSLKRRWSESIPTYNLMYCGLHPHSSFATSIYDTVGIGEYVDLIKYVKTKRYTDKLRDFIFDEIQNRSKAVHDNLHEAKYISSSLGDWVLRDERGWSHLSGYTRDCDYGQRVILWHIVTDLCYYKEFNKNPMSTDVNNNREIAKLLSDYMLYILIMKPNMITSITSTVQGNFLAALRDVKGIFKTERTNQVNEVQQQTIKSGDTQVDTELLNECTKIFDKTDEYWNSKVPNIDQQMAVVPFISLEQQTSVLPYSVILANEVMKIDGQGNCSDKWLILSKVWVDLLCYGAKHSQAKIQSEQVIKGGELITIIWLLMAHFGFGDQFK
ncbi:uncharacterized protein [Rutidosis leptorrhynchoides]|uniref:uncharacterized protein n=1 Tax=Rutidosis leptorrhynchoides TaxID=125765 RepID=UPI003A9A37B6